MNGARTGTATVDVRLEEGPRYQTMRQGESISFVGFASVPTSPLTGSPVNFLDRDIIFANLELLCIVIGYPVKL